MNTKLHRGFKLSLSCGVLKLHKTNCGLCGYVWCCTEKKPTICATSRQSWNFSHNDEMLSPCGDTAKWYCTQKTTHCAPSGKVAYCFHLMYNVGHACIKYFYSMINLNGLYITLNQPHKDFSGNEGGTFNLCFCIYRPAKNIGRLKGSYDIGATSLHCWNACGSQTWVRASLCH